jgi:hypothetical protein
MSDQAGGKRQSLAGLFGRVRRGREHAGQHPVRHRCPAGGEAAVRFHHGDAEEGQALQAGKADSAARDGVESEPVVGLLIFLI